MSICNICSVELTPKNKNKVARRNRCKDCHFNISKENNIKWRAKNPEKQKEYDKKSLIKKQIESVCDCGCRIQSRSLERHQTSKKHVKYKKV